MKYTTSAGISFAGISASASMEYSLEVNYNGKKGGNHGTVRTTSISESTDVMVPSGKRVTAKLIVEKLENARIPFTAKIKRESIAGVSYFMERGTWSGVMKFGSRLIINEEDI